jgi:hypothetical protein
MKAVSIAAALLAACVSFASAGVVITPIRADQVVPKSSGDCFFGVTTPQGCGYVQSRQYSVLYLQNRLQDMYRLISWLADRYDNDQTTTHFRRLGWLFGCSSRNK